MPIKTATLPQFVHSRVPFLPCLLRLALEAIANVGNRRRLEVCAQLARESGMDLRAEWDSTMKKRERIKDRISEREYHVRLERLLKGNFNTRLEPLRSLRTATKRRRELKGRA